MAKQTKKQIDKSVENFLKEIEIVTHPRFRTIVTHGVLEMLVNVLVECSCKHREKISDYRVYTHSVKLVFLNEKGDISDSEFAWLDKFRDLRNEAAHGDEFTLTKDKLTPFKNLRSPLQVSEIDMEEPQNFGVLCQAAVFTFWRQHVRTFRAYLYPKEAFRERLFGTTPTDPKKMIHGH
jgi:hypothetical protein